MADNLNIGDVVVNKAKTTTGRTLEMTIHCYTGDAGGSRSSDAKTDWVLCKWLDTNTLIYQSTCFHVNELEKI